MLEILTKRHKEWINMARSICKNNFLADDLVQEMYLRLNKYVDKPEKILKNGEINPYFIYITLRNLFYDYKRKEREENPKNFTDTEDGFLLNSFIQDPEQDRHNEAMEIAYERIYNSIDNEVSTWHWYDQKLFKLYYYSNKSLRDIAKDTKISLTSIYNSCKNYRRIIEQKFKEDIEDFFNEDYDRI